MSLFISVWLIWISCGLYYLLVCCNSDFSFFFKCRQQRPQLTVRLYVIAYDDNAVKESSTATVHPFVCISTMLRDDNQGPFQRATPVKWHVWARSVRLRSETMFAFQRRRDNLGLLGSNEQRRSPHWWWNACSVTVRNGLRNKLNFYSQMILGVLGSFASLQSCYPPHPLQRVFDRSPDPPIDWLSRSSLSDSLFVKVMN